MLMNEEMWHRAIVPLDFPTGKERIMSKKFTKINVFTLFAALVALFAVANTNAVSTTSSANPLAIEQAVADDCTSNTTCEYRDPTKTEVIDYNETEVTTERTITSTKIEKQIRHYEVTKNVIVAVHMRAGGVKSQRGCVDPIRKGWIKAGQTFINTRKNGSPFRDTWKRGREICHAKRVCAGSRCYMKGTKDDCQNRGIKIRVKGPKLKKQTKKVEYFKSYTEFKVTYRKWTQKTTTRTTSPETRKVTYSCLAGWTLVHENGVTRCKRCQTKNECKPDEGKDGTTGAGEGNSGSPINDQPGAGDSGTAPSAECWALDGNNDPTIPGRWNPQTKTCERINP